MANTKKIKEFSVFKIIAFVFVLLYCVIFIACVAWALLTTLKTDIDFGLMHNVFGLPERWAFDNYSAVLKDGFSVQIIGQKYAYFGHMFLYSILYAVGCTVFSVLCRVVTAYAVAKYEFPGRRILYTISIVTMILPIVGSMPSMIRVLRDLHIYDTFFGAIFMNGGFQGLYFLLFYSAFVSVSDTYLEAARIDGAGHFRIMAQIVMPLVLPTIIAIMVMQFIGFWNGYEAPMMYLPSKPTISYGLFLLTGKSENGFSEAPRQLAGAFLVCIPILIIFIIFRNKIMNNMSVGGIKG